MGAGKLYFNDDNMEMRGERRRRERRKFCGFRRFEISKSVIKTLEFTRSAANWPKTNMVSYARAHECFVLRASQKNGRETASRAPKAREKEIWDFSHFEVTGVVIVHKGIEISAKC